MALKKKTGDVSGEQMAVEQGEVLTTDDFLSQVKKAAAKGATKGRIVSRLVSMLVFFAIVIGGSHYIKAQIKAVLSPDNLFAVEEDVEDHDLTIDNQGILGYTVADFQDAIIEDTKKRQPTHCLQRKGFGCDKNHRCGSAFTCRFQQTSVYHL